MPDQPPGSAATATRVEWGIAFDDGEVDHMLNRSSCIEAIAIIDREIAEGVYDKDDYAGRRIVKRTVTTTTTPWEPGVTDESVTASARASMRAQHV